MNKEIAEYRTSETVDFAGLSDDIKSTYFESISGKSPKEAGLSKENAIAFETKECSKTLQAALVKEDVNEDQYYTIIRKHLGLLLSVIDSVNRIYAC